MAEALRHASNANTNNAADAHAAALYAFLAFRGGKIDLGRLKQLMSGVATVSNPWVGLYRYKSLRDIGSDAASEELTRANEALAKLKEDLGEQVARKSALIRSISNRLRIAPRLRYENLAPASTDNP